jgi:rod shape determining protein RodA
MDWLMAGAALSLVAFGLVSIYSSSLSKGDFLNFEKQLIFLVIAFALMLVSVLVDWRLFRENPYLILIFYFLGILALIFLLFSSSKIRGIRGWYRIGPVLVDPVEPFKIILLILLAKYFSMRHIEMYNIKHIIVSGLYIFLPFCLIAIQPDLGSALIIFCLWLGILLVSGIEMRHFLILLLICSLAFVLSWHLFLRPYQKARLISFIYPQIEPFGSGWSRLQSKIAIGSGGLTGQGFGRGSQVQFGFLTAPQSDFIFAAIAEEFGLVGVFGLLSLIGFLFLRVIRFAFRAEDNFSRFFAIGYALLFVSQSVIHMGMNLSLLPIIGISLPLVSYGGSGLISNLISIGIVESFIVRQS